MAYETEVEKLKRRAAYEALSPGEKVFYQGYKTARAAGKGIRKVARTLGAKPTRGELQEEIERLKTMTEEYEERKALEDTRNKLKTGYKQAVIADKIEKEMAKLPLDEDKLVDTESVKEESEKEHG